MTKMGLSSRLAYRDNVGWVVEFRCDVAGNYLAREIQIKDLGSADLVARQLERESPAPMRRMLAAYIRLFGGAQKAEAAE